jgi:hypothetical protein
MIFPTRFLGFSGIPFFFRLKDFINKIGFRVLI